MKHIKSIYCDSKGNEWVVQKESLPKIKGTYTYWIADCNALSKSFRADLKNQVIEQIKLFIEK
ncbi:MAG: hypothetical protein ACOVNU_11705 [Candidatus Kapaibacteriota bacterium]